MTRLWCLVAAMLLLAVSAAGQTGTQDTPAAAPSLQDLTGLWGAKKWFGPEVRGPLLIERTQSGLVADIAGRHSPVAENGGELSFVLPGNAGAFSGRFEGSAMIRGHWIYKSSASPVVLNSIGPARWAGTVDPGDDVFSFYIFAKRLADGSYAAVLRNPEFDLGNQQGARRLVRDGDAIRLMAGRGEAPDRVLAAGRIEPEMNGFSLNFPGRGGTYDFARQDDASLVYPRPRSEGAYRYLRPPPLDDGWQTSSLARERIDRTAMERLVQSVIDMKMDAADAPEIHALLIARHGRLVLEEYFHGFENGR